MLSSIRSPDRSKFLARQRRIDDPDSPTAAWSGFGEDAELPTRSYAAAAELVGKGFYEPRVVGWGNGLRLLERRGTLDCLGAEERAELIAWWVKRYGGGGEGGQTVGMAPSVVTTSSGSSARRTKKDAGKKKSAGWASQVWEYVRQRKWNRRKRGLGVGRPHFYDAQAEYDAAMFGSRESAESWRSDVAGVRRGGRC